MASSLSPSFIFLPYMVISYRLGIEVTGSDSTSAVVDTTQSHVQTNPNIINLSNTTVLIKL